MSVSYTVGSDGGSNLSASVPVATVDKNTVSATAGMSTGGVTSAGASVVNNPTGHSLSVTHTKIPDFGSQVTAAANVNLLQKDSHKLSANASYTNNMPTAPISNYSAVGAGLGYTYKDTVGANVGVTHTPSVQQTNYSAMANMNMYKTPQTSIDVSGGFNKTVSPHMNTGWTPSSAITFTKFFNFSP